ncbi:MAG: shikimate dehydrogenase [Bacillota bacterium]|nr:shikimate dehydrogenase [Bacillota bacterium]
MKILFGLIGEKLGHSYSAEIHSLLYKKLNINAHYYTFEIDRSRLSSAVDSMKTLNIKGLNVTIPYKTQVMKHIDRISSEAKNIGAVNTITLENGKTHGYNTDYFGFLATLDKYKVDIKDKKIVLLGTGGVSKSAKQYLLDNGVSDIKTASRSPKNADEISYSDIRKLEDMDIIINCTPVGMFPNIDNSPVGPDVISKFKIALDMIYNPEKTKFLKIAEDLGLKTANGLYMLVVQAIKSEELWNNIKIEEAVINEIYNEISGKIYEK